MPNLGDCSANQRKGRQHVDGNEARQRSGARRHNRTRTEQILMLNELGYWNGTDLNVAHGTITISAEFMSVHLTGPVCSCQVTTIYDCMLGTKG
jgi:hypothetical protein